MKKPIPTRHTLRFRRWSRKGYAAFASLGRCVTIGCLRKGVADSSLSKQKAIDFTKHATCEEESAWKSVAEEREVDIGTALELCRLLVTYADTNVAAQEECILKERSDTSTDYQEPSSTFIKLLYLDNPCFFIL